MATIGESAMESREDIPLKSGRKGSRLCSWDEEFFGGSKFINISFAILSLIITVALLVQIYYGDYQVTPHGSVATDSRECSAVGTSILKKGGNAVDAAIASALCLAVVNPHVTGLDASGQILVYNHRTRLNPIVIDFYNKQFSSKSLPRLLIALVYVHKKYGKLSWEDLVDPAATIARNGFLISNNLALSAASTKAMSLFVGTLEAGQKLQMPRLSAYLQRIGNSSVKELYNYVHSLNIPMEYTSTVSQFKEYSVFVPENSEIALPLFANLQKINSTNVTIPDTAKPPHVLKFVEVTKRTYDEYKIVEKFYKGTSSNVAVMDLNDNYVSLITGMTSPFGTGNLTNEGYLLDTDVQSKFPSRLPLIVTDTNYVCGKRIALGITDVATASQIILSLVLPNANATSSIEAPRFNILDNGAIGIEEGHLPAYSQDVLGALKSYFKEGIEFMKEPYSSCNVVEKYAEELNSHSDSRGGGISSRF